mmetsp:Transcript_39716/g.125392  ORF Transcript_39716/g.125392 Transcript_39716/m.125392 type:complete len:206 (-) Transcript_39716:277-894(-)
MRTARLNSSSCDHFGLNLVKSTVSKGAAAATKMAMVLWIEMTSSSVKTTLSTAAAPSAERRRRQQCSVSSASNAKRSKPSASPQKTWEKAQKAASLPPPIDVRSSGFSSRPSTRHSAWTPNVKMSDSMCATWENAGGSCSERRLMRAMPCAFWTAITTVDRLRWSMSGYRSIARTKSTRRNAASSAEEARTTRRVLRGSRHWTHR